MDLGSEGPPTYTDFDVEGRLARGLVDSGSVITILSRTLYEELWRAKRIDRLQPTPFARPMLDASGRELEFDGVTRIRLAVAGGRTTVVTTVAVMPQDIDLLVGTNVLQRSKELRVVLFHILGGTKAGNFVALHRTVVPPRSSTRVHLFGTFPGSGQYLLQSTDDNGLEHGVIEWHPHHTRLPLRVTCTNTTDRPIVLERGRHLMSARRTKIIEERELPGNTIRPVQPAHDHDTTDRINRILATIPSLTDLPEPLRQIITHLVHEFHDCFAATDDEIGQTSIVEHTIDTGSATPVKSKARPIPLGMEGMVKDMIQDYLLRHVIRPSKSPWSSPIILALKKDGTYRFCVDYRRLNSVTKMDSYPLPSADFILRKLKGKKYFSTLDLASGYWQIRLTEEAKEKTAFATPYGHFEWNVLPFGLSTSPACFERMMDGIFHDMIGKNLFIYLDDILLATETVEEHISALAEVLDRLRKANLRLKGKKCDFLKTEIDFLGHRIVDGGLHTDAAKIEKVRNFPVPKDTSELRAFHGLASYYRKFIKNFASISSPLRDLLKKDKHFTWTDVHQQAFDALKDKLTSAPILIQPDIHGAMDGSNPFVVYTDAAHTGMGAVLQQKGDDGQLHPIAFASRSCTNAERNYGITDLEGLGLLYAVQKFRPFIYNTHVIVRTDHQPLIGLLTHNQPSARLMRWALELQDYPNLVIEYVPGHKNAGADGLNRMAQTNEQKDLGSSTFHKVVMAIASSPDPFEDLRRDPTLRNVLDQLERGPVEGYSKTSDKLFRTDTNGEVRLVVPPSLRKDLFNNYHSGKFAHKPPLKPFDVHGPFDVCCADLMQLSTSAKGNRYALVIIDHFTKWAAAYPLRNKTADEVCNVLINRYVLDEGRLPNVLMTDQGLEIHNSKISDACKELGIVHNTTKGYLSRENGAAERLIESIRLMLRKRGADGADWDEHLPYALFLYNRTPHRATGQSPFMMLHGFDPRFPIANAMLQRQPAYNDNRDYTDALTKKLAHVQQNALGKLKTYRDEIKKVYDKNPQVATSKFKTGERVMAFMPRERTAKGRDKLTPSWMGPYTITETSDNSALITPVLGTQRPVRLQFDFLRHVPDDTPEGEHHFGLTRRDRKGPRGRNRKQATTLLPAGRILRLEDESSTAEGPNRLPSARLPYATNDARTPPADLNAQTELLELWQEYVTKRTQLRRLGKLYYKRQRQLDPNGSGGDTSSDPPRKSDMLIPSV